jgi:hypothetical protein
MHGGVIAAPMGKRAKATPILRSLIEKDEEVLQYMPDLKDLSKIPSFYIYTVVYYGYLDRIKKVDSIYRGYNDNELTLYQYCTSQAATTAFPK